MNNYTFKLEFNSICCDKVYFNVIRYVNVDGVLTPDGQPFEADEEWVRHNQQFIINAEVTKDRVYLTEDKCITEGSVSRFGYIRCIVGIGKEYIDAIKSIGWEASPITETIRFDPNGVPNGEYDISLSLVTSHGIEYERIVSLAWVFPHIIEYPVNKQELYNYLCLDAWLDDYMRISDDSEAFEAFEVLEDLNGLRDNYMIMSDILFTVNKICKLADALEELYAKGVPEYVDAWLDVDYDVPIEVVSDYTADSDEYGDIQDIA